MFRAIVFSLLAAVNFAVLTYVVVALTEGQWEHVILGGVTWVLTLLALAGLMTLADNNDARKRRNAVWRQKRKAPAIITAISRGSSVGSDDNDKLFKYTLTATVYPPDMPPYRGKFEKVLDPIADAGKWQVGQVFKAHLVDPDEGGIDYDGPLDERLIPEGKPKLESWETLRSDYIEGSAPLYYGPELPKEPSPRWRSLDIPPEAKPHPAQRPLMTVGIIGGIAAGLVLCHNSVLNTIDRVMRLEFTTTVYNSSVIAEDGAQTVLDLSKSDEFYRIEIYENAVVAEVQGIRSTQVEHWRVARDISFIPGIFVDPGSSDKFTSEKTDYEQAFGIDDVNWRNIPDVMADARELCKRNYERDVSAETETLEIGYGDGQLEFTYNASLKNGERCLQRFDMDGKPIGR